MTVTFPGEDTEYRAARNALLQNELELRRLTEQVAAQRRQLPPGGSVPQDYAFTGLNGAQIAMSDLIPTANRALAIYSLMFRPDQAAPCPMCTSMLDGLNGQMAHIGQHVDLVVVAAATPEQLTSLAKARGWTALRLLSAAGTSYQIDYHAQTPDGSQLPMMNVFQRTQDGIRHFWGSELFFADADGHPRHVDQLWPLWNMLDLTPAGRPDWFPALAYEN